MPQPPIDIQVNGLPRNQFGVNCARNDAIKTIAGILICILTIQQPPFIKIY